MSKDLGTRLEELREKQNISIDDLAQKLSVKRHDIKRWENGDLSPDGEQLIKLSQIYKMPIDEILLNFDTDNHFQNNVNAVAATQSAESSAAKPKIGYNWHMFPYPVIVTAIYLIIGVFFNKWHPTWLLFLTIPIYYTLVEMNRAVSFRKKANIFPYPIICVIVYLAAGFDYNLWHPMWIIFLTIPIYYTVVNGIKN